MTFANAAWATVTALGALAPVAAGAHTIVTTTVLFNREVARILDAKCAHCHVSGGMAMPLQTYEQARPWAESIKQEVIARRMPPWSAERGYGTFANDSSLTPREQQFLLSWIDGGLPEGAGERPEVMDHSGHWMMGPPDRVLEGVAEGALQSGRYRRYVVDLGMESATSIRAFDVKIPGQLARAAFMSILGSGQYLGGWTPAQGSIEFPAGSTLRLDAGAKLAIDVLQSEPEARLVPTVAIYASTGQSAEIEGFSLKTGIQSGPAKTRLEKRLDTGMTIIGFRVQLPDGARSFEMNARTPDGEFRPMVLIRNYHPEWPVPYVLKAPLVLPQGSILTAVSTFDPQSAGDAPISIDFSVVAGVAVDSSGVTPAHHLHSH